MIKNCSIELFSGIGNVIQTLPFATEMLERYDDVTYHLKYVDYPESVQLASNIFSKCWGKARHVPPTHKIFKHPVRRSESEYKCWFIDNNESLPLEYRIDNIRFTPSSRKHRVIIWPDAKDNWPCKQWDKFKQLAKYFEDVAIVGINSKVGFPGATDYRGKLNLLATGGIIKNAQIFIGTEGGISHYAAALGVKTYIIYGCTDHIKNMPPNNAVRISKGLPCQPCQFNGMIQKGVTMYGCDHRKCLANLTVEEVISQIKEAP